MKVIFLLLVMIISGCGTTEYYPSTRVEYQMKDNTFVKESEIHPATPQEISPQPTIVETIPKNVMIKKKSKRLEEKLKRIHQLTE